MSNTRRIEGKGVTAVNDLILNSSSLIPHLDFNDRTDSWDGFVFVYSGNSSRKSDLLGRVPVQIKASEVESFSGKSTTKAIDVSDLINYNNDGGVIIFHIECLGFDRCVYYTSLLPYDLEVVLKNLKDGQKTRNISLELIEESDMNELEIKFREFLIHRKKQFSLPSFAFPIDRVKQIMVSGIASPYMPLEKRILSQPNYFYGKTHVDSPVYDCVTKLNVEEIKRAMEQSISIGRKVYYPNYEVVSTKNYDRILLGNNVQFTIRQNALVINYSSSGTLDEQINDLEFILEFVSTKSIKIAEKNMPVLNHDFIYGDKELRDFKEAYEHLVNIAALLDIFGIEHDRLKIDNMSENDWIQLNVLIDSMVLNNSVPKQKKMPGVYRFRIGNINLLTFIHENKNSRVEIQDFNALSQGCVELTIKNEDSEDEPRTQAVSPYILLSVDNLLCINIDPDVILQSVKDYEHSLEYDGYVLDLCLSMIKVFDRASDHRFLDCSKELLQWIDTEYCDPEIILVNTLQITKRERELTRDEVNLLLELKERSQENSLMLCGISILLEDTSKFRYYFEALSEDERKRFEDFPIFNLSRSWAMK